MVAITLVCLQLKDTGRHAFSIMDPTGSTLLASVVALTSTVIAVTRFIVYVSAAVHGLVWYITDMAVDLDGLHGCTGLCHHDYAPVDMPPKSMNCHRMPHLTLLTRVIGNVVLAKLAMTKSKEILSAADAQPLHCNHAWCLTN